MTVGTMSMGTLCRELQGLKIGKLRKRAMETGCMAERIDLALDSDDPREAVISLVPPTLHFARAIRV